MSMESESSYSGDQRKAVEMSPEQGERTIAEALILLRDAIDQHLDSVDAEKDSPDDLAAARQLEDDMTVGELSEASYPLLERLLTGEMRKLNASQGVPAALQADAAENQAEMYAKRSDERIRLDTFMTALAYLQQLRGSKDQSTA